jgi:large subunit ribosomal protein L4
MAAKAPKLGGGSVSLDDSAFAERFNMPLVHEAVRAELNARRRGTASTKTRGQVRGGGAKPWRQKGTGRARAGSSRSPIWTGGGVVFGPSPRGYTVKVNRKARRAALRGALSLHAGRESLAVFDASAFDGPSTKQASELLAEWGAGNRTLVLLGPEEADAGLSFRNLPRVAVMTVEDAGVADVVAAAALLVSEVALPTLVARATGVGGDEADAEAEVEVAPKPKRAPKPKAEKAAAKPKAQEAPAEPAAETPEVGEAADEPSAGSDASSTDTSASAGDTSSDDAARVADSPTAATGSEEDAAADEDGSSDDEAQETK